MRLTCPNCSARYEVDDDMIPADGRDVQCSNCSTTWFQPGPRTAASASESEPEAPHTGEASLPPEETETDEPAEPETAEAPVEPEVERAQDGGENDHDAPEETDTSAQPRTRRDLDPALRDLLREEAEREARLRQAAQETVETQDEMPLDQPPAAPPAGRGQADRRMPDADDSFDDDALDEMISSSVHDGPRRDLLPDIEEINSTLRATSDRNAGESEASDVETLDEAPRRRRGIRLGFGLVLLIAAGLVAVYSNAVQIAERLPQASPAIQAYVTQVDEARFWLDGLAQGVLQREDAQAAE
ncbi:zinc-ribbon domain-containing protein [Boseongicola sp. H5]|uniref:zinc-ribbon domain-containing protein n=1 Tax=Boseongicola sp. H5 TaxID=2763261 RepID=UPI001D0B842F|nr:zinc-ribbon domain-containing protein [Boseongicola sp. H5]